MKKMQLMGPYSSTCRHHWACVFCDSLNMSCDQHDVIPDTEPENSNLKHKTQGYEVCPLTDADELDHGEACFAVRQQHL